MALTQAQFAQFETVLKKVYEVNMEKKTDYVASLFNVESSEKASEKHQGLGNLGLMKAWNGLVDYDSFEELYNKTYRHLKYSNGLAFNRELFDDKEFTSVKKKVSELAMSAYKTRQTHGASVFNNAMNAAVAGPDDVALCSTAHPYSASNASTQSNTGTLALTVANLDTVEQRMMDFKDNRGEILGVQPMELLVGTYYLNDAKRIIGSKAEAFTGDNTKNIYDQYKYKWYPWITGKKWFVIDPGMREEYLNWYSRRIPKLESESEFDSEVIKYKTIGRWSFGWDAWQWVYGNEG